VYICDSYHIFARWMATRDEVENFLSQVRVKLSSFGVAFQPRGKNMDALLEIDIVPVQREEWLTKLTADHYLSGPNKDTYDTGKPDYFEFGIEIKGKEVYIKLSLGLQNKRIDCMSFHIAERPMNYPLRLN